MIRQYTFFPGSIFNNALTNAVLNNQFVTNPVIILVTVFLLYLLTERMLLTHQFFLIQS